MNCMLSTNMLLAFAFFSLVGNFTYLFSKHTLAVEIPQTKSDECGVAIRLSYTT